MENQYGIVVKNKFSLFIDDDMDPLELEAKQEEAKQKRNEQAKKDAEKGKGKSKSGKKTVLQTENKDKPSEQIASKKEEKVNTSKPNERARGGGRQNRDSRESRESKDNRDQHNDTDRRPPRRRDDNFNTENRERSERQEGGFGGGFNRPERQQGGGFGRNEGGFGRNEGGFGRSEGGFGRSEGGFGRGEGGFGRSDRGRGMRRGGRGGRGAPGGRGGFGKREFDRHSGSDRTGVKATEKREGGGAHNWGTVKDDIEPPPKVDYWKNPKEQMRDTTTTENMSDWNPQTEDVENQDPNESTESAPAEDDSPKQMTLDEWKKQEAKTRYKSEFKLRRAGEGVDDSQWKDGRLYRKSEVEAVEERREKGPRESESEEETEEERSRKRLVKEIKITFNDSPRRGRGGRRGARGPRGGGTRGGGGRGSDRKFQAALPKFDDENDFPSLVKQAA